MGDLEELFERASNAAVMLGSAIASGKLISIVAHNDVDGICCGAITFLAVRRQGGSAHLRFSGHIYEDALAKLLLQRPEFLIICDMGSDNIHLLRKSKIPYLVIDHHATDGFDECVLNPYEFKVDGAKEISSSGEAYLVSKALDPRNSDLSPIAICGAFGDMQSIRGANERIAMDAESVGLMKRTNEIRLIGRIDRPIEYSIRYSTSPFMKGLSGNPDAVGRFLKEAGIHVDPDTTINELSEEMQRALRSGIIEMMVKENASTFEAEKLFGPTFRLQRAAAPTVEDLVDYLESCAAFEKYSLGFSLLCGDAEAVGEVERCRLMYKERIFEGVRLFESAVHMSNIDYLVLEGWTQFSGMLATIYANAGYARRSVPAFTLCVEGDYVKVSARANPQLLQRGINLGKALSVVAERFGGKGGGHDVAAGARIPRRLQDGFLQALDAEVGSQLAERDEGADA